MSSMQVGDRAFSRMQLCSVPMQAYVLLHMRVVVVAEPQSARSVLPVEGDKDNGRGKEEKVFKPKRVH